MSTPAKTSDYATLLNDITALYEVARYALVEAYWKIGRRIVEEEQSGQASAVYGDHLLAQISEDLSETLGHGFSKRNLYKMRQFYLAHKIVPTSAQLSWSQHVELLPIKSKALRQKLEKQIVSQKLSSQQIRQAVQEVNQTCASVHDGVPTHRLKATIPCQPSCNFMLKQNRTRTLSSFFIYTPSKSSRDPFRTRALV